MSDLERAIDGRAAAVAEWLTERLKERDVWLWSELEMAAEQACIDLAEWRWHPSVRAVLCVTEYDGSWRAYIRMNPEEGEVGCG